MFGGLRLEYTSKNGYRSRPRCLTFMSFFGRCLHKEIIFHHGRQGAPMLSKRT